MYNYYMNKTIKKRFFLEFSDDEVPLCLENCENYINKIFDYLEIEKSEIAFVFLSSTQIQEINAKYRHKDYPTDVISFEEGVDSEGILRGDILISLEEVEKNSKEFNCEFDQELRRVIIHGLLHLLGYDHETNDSNEEMLIYQEQILQDIKGLIF